MKSASAARSEGQFAAFKNPGFLAYWIALILAAFAIQIQTIAVGWFVYDLTRNPFDLGLVGLSQFLPALLLVLVTGSVSDRFSRRSIVAVCLGCMGITAAILLLIMSQGNQTALPIFAVLALFGVARAFYNPARLSIVPNLVPNHQLANAIAANTTGFQFATICGPMEGGLLYAIRPELAFGTSVVFFVAAAILVFVAVPKLNRPGNKSPANWQTLSAGFAFIWKNKPVLGAVSLDLFAVLFGGSMALLPVYARDILDVGPAGLGLLQASPAIGAIGVGLVLMTRPIRDHAGIIMFLAVAGFGVATFVFAISSVLWLSVAMLVLTGAFDMISVNVRNILIQVWIPDDVRGRVNAVNQVFIGASNELGAFRAGTMAVWIGPVAAVAVGGVAILGFAAGWSRLFPQLREVKHLR